jgi:hypothetical protein
MQNWVSLIVCNFAVLGSAFFKLWGKYSNTAPEGSIYSPVGRRVGVARPPQSLLSFSPVQTGSGGNTEEEGSRGVELSKVGDIPTIIMAGTDSDLSRSPPPTTMFNG